MDKNIVSRNRKINIGLAVSGMLVWIFISLAADGREAWDTDIFWSFGVPLMLVVNAVGGFLESTRIVLKGIISVALQPIVMFLFAGEFGSMAPLGIILFLFLGLFYSLGGYVGAFVKKQFFSSQTS